MHHIIGATHLLLLYTSCTDPQILHLFIPTNQSTHINIAIRQLSCQPGCLADGLGKHLHTSPQAKLVHVHSTTLCGHINMRTQPTAHANSTTAQLLETYSSSTSILLHWTIRSFKKFAYGTFSTRSPLKACRQTQQAGQSVKGKQAHCGREH